MVVSEPIDSRQRHRERRSIYALEVIRSPDLGVLGQGMRFVLVGGSATGVYVLTTTLLADVAGLPFQLALSVGTCVALLMHFTLQRVFVWVHHEDFALPLRHQAGRYLLLAGMQYLVTTASTSLLPSALSIPTEAVYLGTVVVFASANFLIFRNRIFHPGGATP
jgi:putative flippase GtrA